MGHRGHTEWVRGSSKTRHVRAVFSHIQLHDTECNRKVYLAWNASANYTGGTSLGRKGSGASKVARGHPGADWTWTQWPLLLACLDSKRELNGNAFIYSICVWKLSSFAFRTGRLLRSVKLILHDTH